jgi:UDP-N-acetylmuramyl pentapeptide synthase
LTDDAIAAVVAGSGAADALGVPAERIASAVLEAGRQAGRSASPEPTGAAGPPEVPEPS